MKSKGRRPKYKYSIIDSDHKILIEDHTKSFGGKLKLKDGIYTRK